MNNEEQQFKKGFNGGYFMQKYDPNLTAQILEALPSDDEYSNGFQNGSKEYSKELGKGRLNELQDLKSKDGPSLDREVT